MNNHQRIIVVGASAGGVDALLRIAPGLSGELAAPVLVVLHIGAHASQMPDLLNARGPNRAVFAQSGVEPVPGMIYVAPPDQHLSWQHGGLFVYRGPKEHHARPAVNPLFRSAALHGGPRVVGVILTGMLDDGAAGLSAIKSCGGTAVVQDPDDAVEPSMPLSALANVQADHVTTVDKMASLLNELAQPLESVTDVAAPQWLRTEHAISMGTLGMQELASIGFPSSFTCPDCGGALFEISQGRPLRFLCHTGHAFSLRSLASTHGQVTDEALWSGLRALQERQGILRRLAAVQKAEAPGSERITLDEVAALDDFIARMRGAVSTGPATN